MLTLHPTDLPNNVHYLSPKSRTFVASSQFYRLSWADIVERSNPRFEQLAEVFTGPHRPTATFGVAGLESQEHSILWIGPADTIARFQANPAAGIPWAEIGGRGIRADRWPNSGAWLDFIPATTWNPGGQGIVTEYTFNGAKVVVYEQVGKPALGSAGGKSVPDGPVPMVTFHCTRCHREGDAHDRITSASPADRRHAGLKARQHMLPGACRGAEHIAWGDTMIATVERVARGTPEPDDPTGLYASRCQTEELRTNDVMAHSTCAEVHQARTHTARHRMARAK